MKYEEVLWGRFVTINPDGKVKWTMGFDGDPYTPVIGKNGIVDLPVDNTFGRRGRLIALSSEGLVVSELVLNRSITRGITMDPLGTIYLGVDSTQTADFLIPAENALALFGVSQARESTIGRFGWLP